MSARTATKFTAMRQAFTLIELLAVVAIVLLLLSLLLPALKRGRDMALDARCKAHLHQIGIMQINFAQDHSGILPAGGSVGGMMGSADWQSCWMGMEVLVGSPYEGTTLPSTQWPKNRAGVLSYGTLFPYMGSDVSTAKRLYRCIAEPAGALGLGEGSNGYFDYSMVMAFGGATLGTLPLSAMLEYNTADPTTWQKKPTPLVVEEDPYWWINAYPNVEPGHGNRDKIGVWHYGHGNYLAVGGNVSDCRPNNPAVDPLNPFLNNWFAFAPCDQAPTNKLGDTSTGYGSWMGR